MDFDLNTQKTEQGWASAWAAVMTPLSSTILNLLGACLLIATFKFLYVKSGEKIFNLAAGLGEFSIVVLLFSFFIMQLNISVFPRPVYSKTKRLVETILNLVVCFIGYYATKWFTDSLVAGILKAYPLL